MEEDEDDSKGVYPPDRPDYPPRPPVERGANGSPYGASDLSVAPSILPGASGPNVLTRQEALRARRSEQEQGFLFALPLTGGDAIVRMLTVADRATMKQLPSKIRDELAWELNRSRRGMPTQTANQMIENVEVQERIANAFCVLGFMKPRLVLTEEEVNPNDPYCWCVSDLHIEERVAYLNRCLATEERQQQQLIPFRPV